MGFFGDFAGGLKGAVLGTPGGVKAVPSGVRSGVGQLKGAFEPNAPPGQEERLERFRNQFLTAGQRDPFQIGGLDTGVQSSRDDLIRQLQQGAAGRGPSVATDQFNRSLEATSANQLAQASSGVGNRALAARQAAQNIGGAAQGFAGQAGIQRIQEQLLARQQLGGVLDQAQQARFGASLQQALLNQRGREASDAAQLGFGGLEVRGAGGPTPSFGQQLLGFGGAALAASAGK